MLWLLALLAVMPVANVVAQVAKIGDTEYATLADAVAAVPTNGTATTITMIADETVVGNAGITIAKDKNVVLDLNGKTVTGNTDSGSNYALITNNGTLTIQDATGTGKLEVYPTNPWVYSEADPNGYASNLIRNDGTLTVEKGNLYNDGKGSACYAIDNYTYNGGYVTINGGKIDAAKASAIRLFYNNGGSVTVNGGVIGHYNSDDDCSYMGIQIQNGTNANVTVNGGTVDGNYAFYATNTGGNINITGGEFDSYVMFGSSCNADINISGGDIWYVYAYGSQEDFISGGTFTYSPNSNYIVDGLVPANNGNGGGYSVTSPVVKIVDTQYATLEAAVAAAQDGETVTLLADCAGNGIKVPVGTYTTGLTVDFGGFTYTIDGDLVGSTGTQTLAFQLLKDNTITFKNGTIYSEKAKMLVQNYSNLTLDNMVLTLNNTSYNGAYTLSNNNGDVVIDGSTINANPTTGSFAFDVCRYSSYPSVNVTVTGDSEINGNVEISASKSDAKDGFSLTLEDGTMNGDIVVAASAAAAMESTPDKAEVTKADAFTQAAPAGFEWKDNGDGTSTLTELPSVAKIGNVEYKSLAEAIAAVPTDGSETTITMIADETVAAGTTMTVGAGKNIVLDLNGKTVSGSSEIGNGFYFITNNGTLEITDNSQDADGKITYTTTAVDGSYSKEYVTIYNLNGTLTLTKGTVENTSGGGLAYAVNNSSNAWGSSVTSTFNMTGGKVSAPSGDAALRVYQNCAPGSVQSKNYVNISGGTIDATGIFVDETLYTGGGVPANYDGSNIDTKINISGGTVNGLIDLKIRHPFNTLLNITGGDFTNTKMWVRKADGYATACGEPTAPMVSISGGTFDFNASNNFGLAYNYATTTWTSYTKPFEISGGTYDLPVQAEYCAEGYTPVDNGNGTYTVEQTSVAKIGTTYYATLAEAVAAAQDGETVTLLADCAGNGIQVPQGKYTTGLTIDFGGFTYTVDGDLVGSTGTQTQAFQLLKDNTITFKNGTIYSEKAKMLVQNYSNLTLDGMTLTLNNQSYTNPAYTLSNNNGNTVINNTTINANNANSFAFDVCRYASYPSVSVEVKGTSTIINGNVELFASNGDAKNGFGLTLTSGTMTGNIVVDATAATAIEATPAKVTVTKADTFTKDAPAGYKWESNGDGTSKLVVDEIVFTDGTDKYTISEDTTTPKVTYKRTFDASAVGVFKPWFVPFDYTITAEDVQNFDFQSISNVEFAEGSTTRMKVRLSTAMQAGDKLTANTPYVYVPKKAGTFEFTTENVTLKAESPETSRATFVTGAVKVDFYGVYTIAAPAEEGDYIYYLAKSGTISRGTKPSSTVKAFRWIFRITENGSNSRAAYTFGFAADEDDDVTAVSSAAAEAEGEVVGYYTLNGQKVSEPTKGVYVVKYANGTSKKVVF